MKIRTFTSVAVIGALGLLVPIHSYAFGLGKITPNSVLNEPFRAEIPVTALRGDDAETLKVQLASNKEFAKAGLKRTFLLSQLNFEIVDISGVTTVVVTSSQPVKEPFLDFLIKATTSNGRLIREYTVLLDPPKNVFNKAPEPVAVTKKNVVQPQAKTVTRYENNTPARPTRAPATSSKKWSSDSYKVTSNDTLTGIAKKVRPDSSISMNQMMMALLNSNQNAFINQNINRLKSGVTLTIPSTSDIKSLTKSQADAQVQAQHAEWKNRNKVSNPVNVDLAISDEQMNGNNSTEQSSSAANTESRLKLVAPTNETLDGDENSDIAGVEGGTSLEEQLTLAQETIERQSQEKRDIESRMEIMEKQLQTLREIIEIKDQDLAKVQSGLQVDKDNEALTEELANNSSMDEQLDDTLTEEVVDDSVSDQLVDNTLTEEVVDDALTQEIVDTPALVEETVDTSVAEEVISANTTPEVDSYFAEVEAKTQAMLEEVDNVDAEEEAETEDTSNLTSTSSTSNVNVSESWIDKVKKFYAENRNESLLGGVLALLILIGLMIRGRRKQQEFDWEQDGSVSSQTKTQNVTAKETAVQTPEPAVTPTRPEPVIAAAATVNEVAAKTEPSITEELVTSNTVESLKVEEAGDDLEFSLDVSETKSSSDSALEFNLDELAIDSKTKSSEINDALADNDSLDFKQGNDNETLLESEDIKAQLDAESLDFESSLSLESVDDEDSLTL